MKNFVDSLFYRFFARIIFVVLKVWLATVRIERRKISLKISDLGDESVLVAFWHGNLLGISFAFDKKTRQRSVAMTSRSKDGQVIADFLEMNGLKTVRGSANRKGRDKGGAQAFLQSMRILKKPSHLMCIVPDGPVGPRHQAQPGIIALSAKSKRAILPINIRFKNYFSLKTWDKLEIPWPFSSAEIVFGESIYYTDEDIADEQCLAKAKQKLETQLNLLQ